MATGASRYDIDARLCDSLADAVYTVWQAQLDLRFIGDVVELIIQRGHQALERRIGES